MTGTDQRTPKLTVVFVLWGDAYGAAHVNALVRDVGAHASIPVGYICFTDRDRPDLHRLARQVPIPSPFEDPAFRRGARTKLCQFAAGALDPSRPALFLDLDTMVTGDVARLAEAIHPDGLTILPATFRPAYRVLHAVSRAGLGPMTGRVNSSVMGYWPGAMADLAPQFLADVDAGLTDRFMIADDRWLSRRAADRIRLWSRHHVTKFADAFGHPLRRRATGPLVALTFPGNDLGPDALLAAPDGARLKDRRGRRLIWDDIHTDGWATRIRDHWRAVDDATA